MYARSRRLLSVPLVVVVLGVAVGVVTSLGQTNLDRPFAALVNSAGAWLIAPFLVGVLCRRIRGAAFAGAAVCILQLVAYYATAHIRGYAAGEAIVVFWLLCGLIGGPVFGAAGEPGGPPPKLPCERA